MSNVVPLREVNLSDLDPQVPCVDQHGRALGFFVLERDCFMPYPPSRFERLGWNGQWKIDNRTFGAAADAAVGTVYDYQRPENWASDEELLAHAAYAIRHRKVRGYNVAWLRDMCPPGPATRASILRVLQDAWVINNAP